jgi:hypothetical protein
MTVVAPHAICALLEENGFDAAAILVKVERGLRLHNTGIRTAGSDNEVQKQFCFFGVGHVHDPSKFLAASRRQRP